MKRRLIAKSLFAFISIALVPVYTILFGTVACPIENTLSNIGNFLPYRLDFILWGIVTATLLSIYILYTFRKARFQCMVSRRYLYLSHLFLVLTVLTPAIKEAFPIWYYVHLLISTLFVLFLLGSILMFLHYLSKNNSRIYSKSIVLLLLAVGIPVLLLIVFGKLTGLAEIAFFVTISFFLIILNYYLNKIYSDQHSNEDDRCHKVTDQ